MFEWLKNYICKVKGQFKKKAYSRDIMNIVQCTYI